VLPIESTFIYRNLGLGLLLSVTHFDQL